MLLAVEQLAGGADLGVADLGTGPDSRFGGQKAAGASEVPGWAAVTPVTVEETARAGLIDTPAFAIPFTTITRRRGTWSGPCW